MDLSDWIERYTERDWDHDADGTLELALIGLGWWTVDVALPAIEETEHCETTVLVSSSTEKAGRVADEHGVEHGISYAEYHDGAASEAYDAVYVGTPNATHLEYVETAATLDKAVLCEKPMEATVERAEALVEAADEGDVPLMVAYRMQTDPMVRRARELVAEGFLGEPVSVYGTNDQALLSMIPSEDQWRLDPEMTGYGTSVMDLGIYPINTARYLLRRDPVAASATLSSHHDAFLEVPDERASFSLTLDGGVSMIGTSSQRAQEDSHLKLTGTEGRIELRPAFHGDATLRLARGDLSVEITHSELDTIAEMREEFEYFADRVLTGGDIYPDGRHGLVDMRTIAAIHESTDREGPVEL